MITKRRVLIESLITESWLNYQSSTESSITDCQSISLVLIELLTLTKLLPKTFCITHFGKLIFPTHHQGINCNHTLLNELIRAGDSNLSVNLVWSSKLWTRLPDRHVITAIAAVMSQWLWHHTCILWHHGCDTAFRVKSLIKYYEKLYYLLDN